MFGLHRSVPQYVTAERGSGGRRYSASSSRQRAAVRRRLPPRQEEKMVAPRVYAACRQRRHFAPRCRRHAVPDSHTMILPACLRYFPAPRLPLQLRKSAMPCHSAQRRLCAILCADFAFQRRFIAPPPRQPFTPRRACFDARDYRFPPTTALPRLPPCAAFFVCRIRCHAAPAQLKVARCMRAVWRSAARCSPRAAATRFSQYAAGGEEQAGVVAAFAEFVHACAYAVSLA